MNRNGDMQHAGGGHAGAPAGLAFLDSSGAAP